MTWRAALSLLLLGPGFLATAQIQAQVQAQDALSMRVCGRIMDLQGRGIPRATVTLDRVGGGAKGEEVVADTEGRFSFTTKARGYLVAYFAGTTFNSAQAPFFMKPGATLNIEVRLPLIAWEDRKDPIPLMGLLDGEALPKDAKLKPQADGTWVWEVSAKEGAVLQAGAMVKGYTTHPGHGADVYKDGSGIALYHSHNGRIRFVLDPRKMGKPGEAPIVKMDPALDGFRQAMRKNSQIVNLYAGLEKEGKVSDDAFNNLMAMLQAEIETTPGGLATIYLVTEVGLHGASGRPIPRALAERLMTDLGPDTYLWEAKSQVLLGILRAMPEPKKALKRLLDADRAAGSRLSMTTRLNLNMALGD